LGTYTNRGLYWTVFVAYSLSASFRHASCGVCIAGAGKQAITKKTTISMQGWPCNVLWPVRPAERGAGELLAGGARWENGSVVWGTNFMLLGACVGFLALTSGGSCAAWAFCQP
jgi:hypothetical protein